jgi:hypothetical protein
MIKGIIIWSTTRIKLQTKEFNPLFSKDLSTLGNYIRKWRMDKGISQTQPAKTIDVNDLKTPCDPNAPWPFFSKNAPDQKGALHQDGFHDIR